MNPLRGTIERNNGSSYVPVISIIVSPDKRKGNYSIRAEYFDLDRTHVRWFYLRGVFTEETSELIAEAFRAIESSPKDR